jgi:hypothetical protein
LRTGGFVICYRICSIFRWGAAWVLAFSAASAFRGVYENDTFAGGLAVFGILLGSFFVFVSVFARGDK